MKYLVYLLANGTNDKTVEIEADDVNVESAADSEGANTSTVFLNFISRDEEGDAYTVALFPFGEVHYVLSTPSS